MNIRHVSQQDLAVLGLSYMAYIKPSRLDGRDGYTLYAADGSLLDFSDTLMDALETLEENDLVAVCLQ